MQKNGDVNWLDDRIASLKMQIDYCYSEIKDIEQEIVALKQRREREALRQTLESD